MMPTDLSTLVLCLLALGSILQWAYVLYEGVALRVRSRTTFADALPTNSETLVSVIVPARDEGVAIRSCLESLERQNHRNLQVILVNDRSTDNTGTVMQEFAQRNTQWRVIHVETLPNGWLGKTHAMHQGAQYAQGKWVLFTDGDVVFEPHAISTALVIAERRSLDHLVMAPRMLTQSPLLSAMQLCFVIVSLGFGRPSKIGKSPKYSIGIGAFNLMRREFYEQLGGHTRLKLEILDDILLGKTVVQAGGRQAYIDGKQLIKLSWYPSARQMILGLEKNSFAVINFSVFRMVLLFLLTVWSHLFPYLALLISDGPARALWWLALAWMHLFFAGTAQAVGYSPLVSLLVPLGAWLLNYAQVRSGVLALWRGGIIWRGTRYSLQELRRSRNELRRPRMP